jgi:hypothetical protein
VEKPTLHLQTPGDIARCALARLRVCCINPIHGTILETIEVPLFRKLVDPDTSK